MTDTTLFILVTAGSLGIQLIAPIILMSILWIESLNFRAAIAVVSSWIISILYTIYIYNPAGIAAGIEQGIDSPQMRYDNNTVASTILGGWLYPLLIVLLYLPWIRYRSSAKQGNL